MIWLLTQLPENHSLGIDASSSEATLKTILVVVLLLAI